VVITHSNHKLEIYLNLARRMKPTGIHRADLSKQVAEFLRSLINGKDGLLFETRNGTP
jgi:hypothetical protein